MTGLPFPKLLVLAVAIVVAVPVPVEAQVPAGCDNNDTFRCAVDIELGATTTGIMGVPGNRSNYYRISLDEPGLFRISFYKEKSMNYSFLIYDEEQDQLWRRGSRSREGNFEFGIERPGTYYLNVFNTFGNGGAHVYEVAIRER